VRTATNALETVGKMAAAAVGSLGRRALTLELQELSEADYDLSLTGFDPKELDDLPIAPAEDERANATPPLPDNPVFRLGDLWICGSHRVLCRDATSAEAVAKLLGEKKPLLLVTDPPYGIELDSEWRDRAGLNSCGPPSRAI